MIDEYIRAIEETIADLGRLARGSALYKEERETDFLLLRGEVKFANGSQLHFREFVQKFVRNAPLIPRFLWRDVFFNIENDISQTSFAICGL